jgi:hypothetical protein
MASPAPHLDQFLRAVHRRLVLVRVVERAGLGALAACGAAALLLPLLVWRGEPALAPVLVLVAIGAVVGTGWGVARRPSRLSAAMEADRQLNLHDLLGTAAGAGSKDDSNPWLRTVLALADEQCRRHTPAQVVLRRYGSRAWGGIGLAASLVLTLAALFRPPGTTPAVASRDPDLVGETSRANPDHWPEPSAPVPAATARNAVGVPPHESRSIDPSTEEDSPRRDEASVPSGEPSNSTPRSTGASGTEGKGGGAGRARPRAATLAAPPASSPIRGVAPRADAGANATAAGGGSDAPDPSSTQGKAPGAASPTTNGAPVRAAPWESSTWPADARAANGAVETGRVPDSYRDMVREFFNR